MEHVLSSPRVAGGAGSDTTTYVGHVRAGKVRITKVYLDPDTATAKDATDKVAFNVKKGSTVIGTHSSSTTALAAGTLQEVTISATGKDLELDQTNVLTCEAVNSASGKAHGLTYRIVVEDIRS